MLGAPAATCSALQMTWRAEDCCCTHVVPAKPSHARRSHLSLRNPIICRATNRKSWWFINLWLNLYMHRILDKDLNKMNFPGDHAEDEQPTTRRCTFLGKQHRHSSVKANLLHQKQLASSDIFTMASMLTTWCGIPVLTAEINMSCWPNSILRKFIPKMTV